MTAGFDAGDQPDTGAVTALRHRDRQVVDHDNLTKGRTPSEAIYATLVIGQTALNFAPRTLAETQAALARVCTVLEHSTTVRGNRHD